MNLSGVSIQSETVRDHRVVTLRGTFPQTEMSDRNDRLFTPEQVRMFWETKGVAWELQSVEAAGKYHLAAHLQAFHIRTWYYPLVGDFGDVPGWLESLFKIYDPTSSTSGEKQ